MKTIIIILIVFILIGGGITIACYTYKAPPSTEAGVLWDETENFIAHPNATEILGLYNQSGGNKWNGAEFNFSKVTDVSYNPVTEIKLDAANEWLSNELERIKEVKEFQKGVTNIISDTGKDTVGRWHSSIYLPIARQLDHLSQSRAQRRILIVYSDLMENELGLSFYNPKEFSLMKSNPDSIKKLFESWQPLPPLNGIEIYLIYQPVNAETDSQYQVVSEFYRNMLQGKGALVHVSANLLN